MLLMSGIIKKAMHKRGYKHRREEDPFSLRGEYVRWLQYVYAKEYSTDMGPVVDLVYFGVDIVSEKLVIGFFRENPKVDHGVFINDSISIPLHKFNALEIDRALNKLIVPMRSIKKEGF